MTRRPTSAPRERLVLVPTTISDANEFVRQHHRHHGPSQSGVFAVAVAGGGGSFAASRSSGVPSHGCSKMAGRSR